MSLVGPPASKLLLWESVVWRGGIGGGEVMVVKMRCGVSVACIDVFVMSTLVIVSNGKFVESVPEVRLFLNLSGFEKEILSRELFFGLRNFWKTKPSWFSFGAKGGLLLLMLT